MKKRGSAIIIAMLLISAVGTIAFTFSRSLFIEIANANIFENGTIAYYSAESGIEEGLLRYRLNRNVEMPAGSGFGGVVPGAAVRNDLTERQMISANLKTGTKQENSVDIDDSDQMYDLRITAKSDKIGVAASSDSSLKVSLAGYNTASDPAAESMIKRDQSKSFDLSNVLKTSDVNFWFKPLTDNIALPAPFNQKKCVLIEAKITGQDIANNKTDERKIVFYSNYPGCNYSGVFEKNNLPASYIRQYSLGADNIVQIQNLKSILWPTVLLKSATLSIKPIGSDIAFSIERKNPMSDDQLYGATTKIESTGYYGDATRKLEISIDRQSGTLYDLFDYVIYKAQ